MRNVFFTFVTDFHELFLPRHHFENMFTKPAEIQGFVAGISIEAVSAIIVITPNISLFLKGHTHFINRENLFF